ncbi:hypothetical protein [Spirilliplanes yamanashiensis]|uniref:Uncharacterized protein n=1 Tax=Spirilliplanes yamanashiensis TaxID=42233 RepID=A0A8J3Y8Q7_9ACTN|nr:hypothetical protein [Spirilliplanes yamanashiensis]MDP9815320.1 hypothetical protein [Spirilliplanes yamanashiensis]GIJ03574.1 hypothetical protein Sya03_29260 [Spirilliplanes yamanashiensis]
MTATVAQLDTWLRTELPRLNRAVLFDAAPSGTVAAGLARDVLPLLPDPADLTTLDARRLVIGLGFAGASIARHHQEHHPERKADPLASFAGLTARGRSFPDYFAALAEAAGDGHYQRETYASIVLWNVPTTEVRVGGVALARLPGVFEDGLIRSYTGDPGEEWFFELVKKGQTIEAGANALLEPISDGLVDPCEPDGLDRVRLATRLIEELRALFLDFANPTGERGMEPEYFMDVFRQYAVHWRPGDIPPSGALDVDALKRDFLLGIGYPGYDRHVAKLEPALLRDEWTALHRLMQRPPLPETVLRRAGVAPEHLAELTAPALAGIVAAHPALVDWYLLLSAHARAAGAHLMLSKRFLFNPQRGRDSSGIGDKELVSNRSGTTGMDESFLDRLTRVRRAHLLAPLRRTPAVVSAGDVKPPRADDIEVVMVIGGRTVRGSRQLPALADGAPRPRRRDPHPNARQVEDA